MSSTKSRALCLMGFMGSGKSTVGRALSEKLKWRYLDTDIAIEKRFGMDISSVFSTYGEGAFREAELEVIEEAAHLENTVISTGGGLPCTEAAIEIINRYSDSYYLYISAQQLSIRLWREELRSTRPLLQNLNSPEELKGFITSKLVNRERYYYDSKGIIDASQNVDTIVEDIIQLTELAT